MYRPHVHSGAVAPTPILLAPPWGRCDHRSWPARCSAQTVAPGLRLGYVAERPIGGTPASDERPAQRLSPEPPLRAGRPAGRLQQGWPASELRAAVGGARTCASCNVVGGRAWALLMDAEALSVCGEELGELRHYGAGLRGTAVVPTGCMLLRL